MPSQVEHGIEARSAFRMQSLYIDPDRISGLPASVGVLQVSPLLRELIAVVIAAGNEYVTDGPIARIMSVIVDQIRAQPVVDI